MPFTKHWQRALFMPFGSLGDKSDVYFLWFTLPRLSDSMASAISYLSSRKLRLFLIFSSAFLEIFSNVCEATLETNHYPKWFRPSCPMAILRLYLFILIVKISLLNIIFTELIIIHQKIWKSVSTSGYYIGENAVDCHFFEEVVFSCTCSPKEGDLTWSHSK